MSTRSMIYLQVNDSDLGKSIYPDLLLLPNKKHILPFIEKKIQPVEIKDTYMGIYHHNDSNPHWLGKELLEHYNTYDSVLNLMLFGDESSIINGIEPYFYSREDEDETWERNKPVFTDDFDKALEILGNYSYFYLFENDEWKVCPNMQWKHNWKGFKTLKEII